MQNFCRLPLKCRKIKMLQNKLALVQQGDQRLAVFDFMPGGSLREALDCKQPVLTWRQRLSIALGAARGLAYLHEEAVPALIHRDIKSSNVLIDGDRLGFLDSAFSRRDMDERYILACEEVMVEYLLSPGCSFPPYSWPATSFEDAVRCLGGWKP